MAHNKKNDKQIQKINRNFMIAKVLLVITPLICYLYVYLKSLMMGLNFQSIFVKDPSTTVVFLISMIHPYIAYIIQLTQKHFEQGDYKFACINIGLLLIAEAITLNVLYLMMLGYIFYGAISYYRINIKDVFKVTSLSELFFMGGGSLIIIALSSISLFATIRIV